MKSNECDLKAMAMKEEIKGDKWKISASKCVADPLPSNKWLSWDLQTLKLEGDKAVENISLSLLWST